MTNAPVAKCARIYARLNPYPIKPMARVFSIPLLIIKAAADAGYA
jgi:hypothetical protein